MCADMFSVEVCLEKIFIRVLYNLRSDIHRVSDNLRQLTFDVESSFDVYNCDSRFAFITFTASNLIPFPE